MNYIGTKKRTDEILTKYNLFAKKGYGQNFIIDNNILESITNLSGVTKDIDVIEIGPGIGSLTEHLLEKANKVLAYEIDIKLIDVLHQELAQFENFILLNQDILKSNINKDIDTYLDDDKDIYIISNLPYYITTPIIMSLLESKLNKRIKRFVFMMQYEVAERITANKGGKEYNNLTIAIKYYAKTKKILNVSRNVFNPKPNVDSAVVSFDLYEDLPYKVSDEDFFFKVVRTSFQNRRKTLVNNLNMSYNISKNDLTTLLNSINIKENVRAEELDILDFISLSENLKKALMG